MKQPRIVKPVPLDTAFADAGSLNEKLCRKILSAALGRQQESGATPHLYSRVPRGGEPWVCYTAESISTNEKDDAEQTERYPGLIGRQKARELAKSYGSGFVTCWIHEPEVGFVVLNKEHIGDLISKGSAKARCFAGCLGEAAPMSRVWFASEDASPDTTMPVFIRASQSGSYLAQRSYRKSEHQNEDSAVGAAAIDQLQSLTPPNAGIATPTPDFIVNTIPHGFEHEVDILLRDVHVDRSVVLYLRDVHGLPLQSNDWDVIQMRLAQVADGSVGGSSPLQSFPFHLKDRAFGVEALYNVARKQYGPLVAGGDLQKPPNEDVVQAFVSFDKKLFNKSGRAIQAAKLTRRNGSRNQGLQGGERRDFTSKALDIVEREYSLRGPFVSESLALIVHATKQWQGWKKMNKTPSEASIPFALRSELETYGFKGAELKAILKFITYPGPHATSPTS